MIGTTKKILLTWDIDKSCQ